MRRPFKTKSVSTSGPVRRAVTSASAAARRPFPAWIDSDDRIATVLPAVSPRVRGALVLRPVVRPGGQRIPGGSNDLRMR